MRRTKKESREFEVLVGLIELYLETGRPVGSQTLKEQGFEHLSSATIRNYFAELEHRGFLQQPHASGGRTPTMEAFRLYAEHVYNSEEKLTGTLSISQNLQQTIASQNVHHYLQHAADKLSELTGLTIFLSSVRFDHDFILEVKLVIVDAERVLCVLLTDFGQILTEVIPLSKKLSLFALRRIESELQWRIKGGKRPYSLNPEEEEVANYLYHEMMVRYLVRYANFSEEELYRTGFSRLLSYPEFSDPVALSAGLSLFENTAQMRLLLNDCIREGKLSYWIGSDLSAYKIAAKGCSVLAIPYSIGSTHAGAIGLLGPCRMPYKQLFGTLRDFSDVISQSLTKTLSKFKLSFRQPRTHSSALCQEALEQATHKMLVIKEPYS
ncbi:MAG: heat-inducible transcriptional repressor HrcA [Verrucomicrobia bacterium]|nr:heat-inducible transcriptional repressor HrcA [Verrucomicrobiota bacterium]MBS0645256.1 heat-inducible transcriptional repressor HrcA [Verrucomicrobiota bacterium]